MTFCFDMDGTLTAAPHALREIMRSLRRAGNTVYILTGSLGETPVEQLKAYRLNQARQLGIFPEEHFDDIVCAVAPSFEGVAKLKGIFCRQEGVAFMVEDSTLFRDAIAFESPGTLCLMMK